MRAPTREARKEEDIRTLEAGLPAILGHIDHLFTPANTWLCGICGCLCKVGEVCPRCRADLVGPIGA